MAVVLTVVLAVVLMMVLVMVFLAIRRFRRGLRRQRIVLRIAAVLDARGAGIRLRQRVAIAAEFGEGIVLADQPGELASGSLAGVCGPAPRP